MAAATETATCGAGGADFVLKNSAVTTMMTARGDVSSSNVFGAGFPSSLRPHHCGIIGPPPTSELQ
jgi:hypothetical protein